MGAASMLSSEEEEEEESTDDEEEKHRFVRLPVAHGRADGDSSSSSSSDTETQEEEDEEVQPTQTKKTPATPLPVSSVAAADADDGSDASSNDDGGDEDSDGVGSPKSIGQIVAANRKPLRYENGAQKRPREEAPKEEEEDSSDEVRSRKKKKKKKKSKNGDDESALVEAKKSIAEAAAAAAAVSSSSKKELGLKTIAGSVEKVKGRKQLQASKEEPTAAASTTAMAKKKLPFPAWTTANELAFVSILVSYVKSGRRIPGQNDEFWDSTSQALEGVFTGKQLYNKLRGMKLKYKSFLDGTKPLPKSPHEDALFKMWRRIWGNEGGGGTAITDTETEHPKPDKTQLQQLLNSDINTKDSAAKQLKKSSSKQSKTVVKSSPLPPTPPPPPPKPEEEQYSLKTEQEQLESELKSNTEMVSIVSSEKKPAEELKGHEKNLKEEPKSSCICSTAQTANQSIMLDELRSSYSKLLQEVESKCASAIESALSSFRGSNKNSQSYCWGGGMMPPCSSSPFPCIGNVLDMNGSDGNLLKKQWDEQRLLELKAFSKRLELMQEQCRLQQEQLKLQLGVD